MKGLTRLADRLSHRLAMHVPVAPFRMRNRRPLVTVTFDDVPLSAAETGAPLLESFGARGTFYVASGLIGTQGRCWPLIGPDGVAALHRAGHEIGLHTHGHRSFAGLAAAEVAAEVGRNRAALRRIVPDLKLENFAYPYGIASFAGKRRLNGLVRSSRSIVAGVNDGLVDLQFLKAVPLYDCAIDRAGVERWLDEALARAGWLIFLTHDVSAEPSPYGCSPALLAAALAGAQRRGIACVTLAEGLAGIGAAAPAQARPLPVLQALNP